MKVKHLWYLYLLNILQQNENPSDNVVATSKISWEIVIIFSYGCVNFLCVCEKCSYYVVTQIYKNSYSVKVSFLKLHSWYIYLLIHS